jgi:hypothetical protein
MPIVVSGESAFQLHPEGQFRAVCVDVVERRDVPTAWGLKTKVRIVYQTDEVMENGKPFLASSSFNASLAETSRLRPFLEAWRGKKFTADELKGFDLEHLIGAQAVIQITHTEKDGKTYDNVTAVMRPLKGLEPITARDYTRMQDRPVETAARVAEPVAAGAGARSFSDMPAALDHEDDDGMPF